MTRALVAVVAVVPVAVVVDTGAAGPAQALTVPPPVYVPPAWAPGIAEGITAGATLSAVGAVAVPVGVSAAGLAVGAGIGYAGVTTTRWVWDKYRWSTLDNSVETVYCTGGNPSVTMVATASGERIEGPVCGGDPYVQATTYERPGVAHAYRCEWANGQISHTGDGLDGHMPVGMFRLTQRCGPFYGEGAAETTLTRLVNGTAIVTVHKVVRAPSWIRRKLTCQKADGSMTSLLDDFKPSSLAIVQGQQYERPAMNCPTGSHAAGYETWAMDNLGNRINGWDAGSWTPDPRWTDTTNPNARCMALSGSTPCEVQPLPDPSNTTTTTWANTDPRTGVITDPATGQVTGVSPGCTWGGKTYQAEDCYPTIQRIVTSFGTRKMGPSTVDTSVYREPNAARTLAMQCVKLVKKAGRAGDECETEAILLLGKDAEDASKHDADVMLSRPDWVRLHYRPREESTAPDPASQCEGLPRPAGMQCDEYPLRSTVESGPNASFRLVNADHNGREGVVYGQMADNCGHRAAYIASGTSKPFLVLPLHDVIPHAFYACGSDGED